MNMETVNFNKNFWWGGVLGEGFEQMLLGNKKWKSKMLAEDKKRCKGQRITEEMKSELDVCRRLIEVQLECVQKQPIYETLKLTESQVKFAVPLDCGVTFVGTKDGEGEDGGKRALFEIKTASQVNQAYLDALRYGKQVNGYAYSDVKMGRKDRATVCRACVFVKPGKWIKKGQTVDEFVDEIRADICGGIGWKGKTLTASPQKYYSFHRFSLGQMAVKEVGCDIEQETADLLSKYERAKDERQLMDPHYWPKRENKCHEYSGCEFQRLCLAGPSWEAALNGYKQRTMMYDLEEEELK